MTCISRAAHKGTSVFALLDELKACSSLEKGKRIHESAIQNGVDSDVRIANSLVRMYGKCGSTRDARNVFEQLPDRRVVSWNALILGYAENRENHTALDLFSRMDCLPDAKTFLAVLKACVDPAVDENSGGASGDRGKVAHLLASSSGCDADIQVKNTLVDMYAKCGNMEGARDVFEAMPYHTVVSWTALMLGYVEKGQSEVTLDLLSRMVREGCAADQLIFVAALKACSDLAVKDEAGALHWGKAIHMLASYNGYDSHIFVKSSLVDMYAKCRSMQEALSVFRSLQHPDVVCWTTLIRGYAENGEGEMALSLFSQMHSENCQPDSKSFVAALRACTDLAVKQEGTAHSERGKSLHLLGSIVGYDSNTYVEGTLLDMYSKCGNMRDARRVFESIQYVDLVSWNSLILGYADNGQGDVALDLLSRAVREGCSPDSITFVAALKACTDVGGSREQGKAVHLLASSSGSDSNVYLRNTLLDMYAKCGCMEDARQAFEEMTMRTEVSWTALMLGYADNGEGDVVLELLGRMRLEKCEPVALTFVAALKACAILGALDYGKAVHQEIQSRNLEKVAVVINCLVDFYAKCGGLVEAEQVFESHGTKSLISWSSLMAGYSRHGDSGSVFRLFERMLDAGLQPNKITFLCVLTACSHAGLVEKGKGYFQDMFTKHGISPNVEHYTCVLDMLGRANELDNALALLRSMPFSSDDVTWMTVMGACRKWKNVQLARLAFESLVSLEDRNAGPYVLMANIYGTRGMWKEQAAVQATRMRLKAWKRPGQSWWTTRAGAVHTFSVGDRNHPQNREMQARLQEIGVKMRELGYVADLSSVTRNLSDPAKEDALCGHSEKLAIACALVNTGPGETIRIIKNLRVCDDCHTACALISKIEDRTILCRDTTRFHVFKNGKCSCGDFW